MVKKFINRRSAIHTLSNEEVNFVVTAIAKDTKIFFLKVFSIFVYMVNRKSLGSRFANSANLIQFTLANRNITPRFLFSAITKMLLTFKRELTFSRTIFGFTFSKWPSFISFLANNTSKLVSRQFSAISGAKSRSMDSIVARIKFLSAPFTNTYQFSSCSHIGALYAN